MSDDEKAIYEHMLTQYRQDADVLKFNLAQANAQIAVRDQIIAELSKQVEQALVEGPQSPTFGERATARWREIFRPLYI